MTHTNTRIQQEKTAQAKRRYLIVVRDMIFWKEQQNKIPAKITVYRNNKDDFADFESKSTRHINVSTEKYMADEDGRKTKARLRPYSWSKE